MFNFTYADYTSDGLVSLNGIKCTAETSKLINVFNTGKLSQFYKEAEELISDMKSEGAEAIVLFIHWGNEYDLDPSYYQQTIAKKMCALGCDVIIGGHPHKVQPIEIITDKASGNTSVCLYSAGNILSNQVISEMFPTHGCKIPDNTEGDHVRECNDNGHTEDGILFTFEFEKYSDGTVGVGKIDALPLWCCRSYSSASGKYSYRIIPLDTSVSDWSEFGLTENQKEQAVKSYDRTMELVKKGLERWNGK
jgi:poly-gamma-glutamate synthesis protein (capsule biosynthesis protein)